ncbi:NERD domain-containing protein [Acidithiobacillus sp. HP-6]|uniref:nuclease-related domain-containing protein n=1 Tax=unclassified Acidithiobacillus TaxID=2614800 RepID=UPI00187AE967|nr:MULTISPECIES: nuclease-related domain-containing protein [unclassified Acidithiobacillus]MBE7563892.1 NERD domain-containing protein [Acidithiobacillus sp. HP-6]MBE7569050.1 NERD domain-containing protein [Acidithiobacillus sp. HP-2]
MKIKNNGSMRLINVSMVTACVAFLLVSQALIVFMTGQKRIDFGSLLAIAVMVIIILNGAWYFWRYQRISVQKKIDWRGSILKVLLLWIFLILTEIPLFIFLLYLFILGVYAAVRQVGKTFFGKEINLWMPGNKSMLHNVERQPARFVWPEQNNIPVLSTISLHDRFSHWKILSSVRPLDEDAVKSAGDAGEKAVLDTLNKHRSLRGSHLYANKRIPNVRQCELLPGKRVEIDLILLTQRHVHVIEVKNWSGSLMTCQGNKNAWVRHRRSDVEPMQVPNVVVVNAIKAENLKEYLFKNGIQIAAEQIRNHVFFTNNRLEVDDNIANMPEIVTVESLGHFSMGAGMKTLDKIILQLARLILEQEEADVVGQGLCEAFPEALLNSLVSTFDTLASWDRIKLHGGRELTGDFLWADAWGSRCRKEDLQRGEYYQIRWRRNRYFSLMTTLMALPLGTIDMHKQSVMADPDGQIYFHAAGQQKPTLFPLVQLDMLEKG